MKEEDKPHVPLPQFGPFRRCGIIGQNNVTRRAENVLQIRNLPI
jgi:hypothetical protein